MRSNFMIMNRECSYSPEELFLESPWNFPRPQSHFKLLISI